MAHELSVGTMVFTADGRELGRVKKVEESAFLIDAPKQFDYWLQDTLIASADAKRVSLSISEAELGGYKMDRPNDHNGFQEKHAANLDPAAVRDQTFIRGGSRLR